MSAGDPAFPRKMSYREVAERAVGGSKANPNNVKEQLAMSKLKKQMEKQMAARAAAQSTDSNQ